jgi:hypothetical protein
MGAVRSDRPFRVTVIALAGCGEIPVLCQGMTLVVPQLDWTYVGH